LFIIGIIIMPYCLQCFDTIAWASGRACSL